MAFDVALLWAEVRPVYQRIAEVAEQLHRLGLSNSKSARLLRVDDKTVAKANWWRGYQGRGCNVHFMDLDGRVGKFEPDQVARDAGILDSLGVFS